MSGLAPPFAYPGGKSLAGYSDLVQWVVESLEPPCRRYHYLEPFAGLCGVLLARDPAPVETVNDLDGGVVRFLKAIQAHPIEMVAAALRMIHSRRGWEEACEVVADESRSDLERGAAWMLVRSQSFGGQGGTWLWGSRMRPGKLSTGIAERCARMAARLERVQIEHIDAVALLERVASKAGFLIFVDPPYRGTNNSAYNVEVDHDALEAVLLRQQGRVAMIGYADNEWPGLEHWRQEDFTPKRPKRVGSTKQTGRQTSRLWLNWEPA